MEQPNKTSEHPELNRPAEVKPFPSRPEQEGPAPAPSPAAAAAAPATAKSGGRKKYVVGAIALIALAFGARAGYDYWTVGQYMVTTDDAYLTTDVTSIAPRVQGYIEKIDVIENERVKAGDVLFHLDDGDYVNAVKTAQSQVATQQETIKRIGTQVTAGEASVTQAEAQKTSALSVVKNDQLKFDRLKRLVATAVATQSDLDDATAALDQANASVAGADAAIALAQANVQVLKAQQAEAQSSLESLKLAVDQAQRNLGRTVLRAPVDGIVGNIAVHEGDLLSPGQKIAAVVPVDEIYIEANYKETQLADIAPGAKVNVTIDALNGQTFTGTVASVAPATGSMFSLLPPNNATGNFTKIVQRVPVRIKLPSDLLASGKLHAGLSVVTAVDLRTVPGRNGN